MTIRKAKGTNKELLQIWESLKFSHEIGSLSLSDFIDAAFMNFSLDLGLLLTESEPQLLTRLHDEAYDLRAEIAL